MDVAYQMLVRVLGALLWFTAAWHKARAPRQFWALLEAYAVPVPAARVSLWALLVTLETGLALAFCLWPRVQVPALASAVLLLFYAAALVREIVAGRVQHPCGCAGSREEGRIGWGLVARNAVLATLFLAATGTAQERNWTWLDTVTVVGAATALVLLYLAIDTLVQQSKLPSTRTLEHERDRG